MTAVVADGEFLASWQFDNLLTDDANTDPNDWELFRIAGNAPVNIVSGGATGDASVLLQYDDPVTAETWAVTAGAQIPQFTNGPVELSTGTVT